MINIHTIDSYLPSLVQVLQVADIRHMARSFFRTLRRILLNSFLVSYGTSSLGISYGASTTYAQPLPDCHFCSDSLVFPTVQVAQSTWFELESRENTTTVPRVTIFWSYSNTLPIFWSQRVSTNRIYSNVILWRVSTIRVFGFILEQDFWRVSITRVLKKYTRTQISTSMYYSSPYPPDTRPKNTHILLE